MKPTICHFDGDVLTYQAGFAAEQTFYDLHSAKDGSLICTFPNKKLHDQWAEHTVGVDPICTPWSGEEIYLTPRKEVQPLRNALGNVKQIILKALKNTKTDQYKVLISGPTNFRNDIPYRQGYKENRDNTHRPYWYKEIKEYLVAHHNAEITINEEADDALGINQTPKSIICTIDKDLDMVPGWHYNIRSEEMYKTTEPDALRFFYKQLLTGDGVDNILGCGHKVDKVWASGVRKGKAYQARQGIGSEEAEVMIKDANTEEELFKIVFDAYVKEFGTPELALDNLITEGRLLWIRRKPNQMWSPKKSLMRYIKSYSSGS